MQKKIVQKFPLAIRWFHWINFPVLGVMIWSGLLIYWANDIYRIGFGHTTLIKFFPQSFYDVFKLSSSLAQGMSWHFAMMWLFMMNGILYVSYTIISGEWKHLIPGKGALKNSIQVFLYDFYIIKKKPEQGKYNAAQQIAYTSIIIMGVFSVLTGWAIYKPIQHSWLCTMMGGYEFARILHFSLTIGYVLFFFVHIFQVIKTGWNNFRSMITGFEIVKDNK